MGMNRIKIIFKAHHGQSPLDKIGKLWVQWLKTFSLPMYKKDETVKMGNFCSKHLFVVLTVN
jgi:hypothetical protein